MIVKKTKIEKHIDDRGLLMAIIHISSETKCLFTILNVPSNSIEEIVSLKWVFFACGYKRCLYS